MVLIQGEEYFRKFIGLVTSRSIGSYLPYTTMAPQLDFVNHSHRSNAKFVVVSKQMHEKGDDEGYQSDPMRVKGDFSLFFGEKHAKEGSVEPLVDNLAVWREEIKTKDLWDITYKDELWEDEDAESDQEPDPCTWLQDSNPEDTYISLISTKPIAAGEQIYISYGARSNSNLLLDYGFCYQNNPYDYAEIVCNDGG